MGTAKKMHPSLIHMPIKSDQVYTPPLLAIDMVKFFQPSGTCLDPCAGENVFFSQLPAGSDWCEISRGRDFYAWQTPVDWIISNPPYSHYAAWVRHSMTIAQNIVYLVPLYKLFASNTFLGEVFAWGGITHIRRYGTGSQWGLPFGHALAAIYYQKNYTGDTAWSTFSAGEQS